MPYVNAYIAFTTLSCYNKNMKKSENNKNWPLVGNGHIIDFLSKSIKNDNLAGTYIFCGPDNLGKTTVANFFAQTLLCQNNKIPHAPFNKGGNVEVLCGECISCKRFSVKKENKEVAEEVELGEAHGDLHLVKKEKDKKNISIEQIREFIRKLNMSSFLNSYKIGIIKHAHSLSQEAANALLKTLEEPKDKVLIILVTSDIDLIPQTIVSRGQILKFNPVSSDIIYDYLINKHKASRSAAKNFSKMSLGRPALAVKFLQDKEFYSTYTDRINTFLNFFNQDINERFKSVESLLGEKKSGHALKSSNQETVKLASRTIEAWLSLTRDMILLEFNQKEKIQHEITEKELINARTKLNLGKLLNLTDALRQADKYLKANVNSRLVLESIAINI